MITCVHQLHFFWGFWWDHFQVHILLSVPNFSWYFSGQIGRSLDFCWFSQELLLRNLVMRSTMFYGFRVRMWVPLRPPSRSTNAFYLELLGPNFAGNRCGFGNGFSHFQIRCSIFWVGGLSFEVCARS